MESTHHPLFNWIPVSLIEKDNEVYFEWIYLADIKYLDPFFDETIAKCKSHAYNSKPYKVISTVDNLIEWSKQLISVELKSLVFHVSRCGSTMLSQSLATSSENIMVSEAPIMDQILRSDFLGLEQKSILIKAVIAVLGQKRFPEQQHLIIKLDAWHIFKASYLRSLFPEIPFALLYRNPEEVLKSHQKMMGMHMVPNVLPSVFFGISDKETHEISFQQYGALVLEKYYQGFLDFYERDQNVIILNYNEGMQQVIAQFVSFINVKYPDAELDKMYDRLKRHSKNGTAVFVGDTFKKESLQIDFSRLAILHEKLNTNFIAYMER
ncbi:hypothetical protein BC749_104319 [Flavobacterium araucananum]|uniref:Sulfotransferase family protein n=1 Tax=Flavobacterium araucananum TaxID=946678 RepID=A0A227PEF8_9FLAO|nr:sulfotransferase family protein [Flavobacterium araucananum]OXG08311.1 sulfotransferase family protein [Flavobacterium araucananum]PWJ99161.1 hypothetical protein BC749_104319 [Flavobacterium araucananum]